MTTTLITRNGRTIGYEVTTSRGRRLHLGGPPQAALRANQPARCPECQRYRDNSNAACSNCGALPTPMPAAPVTPGMIPMPVPDVPWYRQHAAAVPDIGQQLDDAIRARSNGRVGNFWAAPTPAPVAPPCPRVLLHFDAPATLDMVVARQRQTGLRPPDPHAPLHTMDATRCERCHRQSCNCPPKAPSVLDVVAQRQAARLAVMERAAVDAGLPPLVRTVGMS